MTKPFTEKKNLPARSLQEPHVRASWPITARENVVFARKTPHVIGLLRVPERASALARARDARDVRRDARDVRGDGGRGIAPRGDPRAPVPRGDVAGAARVPPPSHVGPSPSGARRDGDRVGPEAARGQGARAGDHGGGHGDRSERIRGGAHARGRLREGTNERASRHPERRRSSRDDPGNTRCGRRAFFSTSFKTTSSLTLPRPSKRNTKHRPSSCASWTITASSSTR